jgi:hypothetical protein
VRGGGNACLRTGIPAADNPLEAARHPAAAATEVRLLEAAVTAALPLEVAAATEGLLLEAAVATAVLLLEAAVTAVLLPADMEVLLPAVTAAG